MNIDDTKRCICNPALSGKSKKCPRCHPKRKVVINLVRRDSKPAQVKKHNAVKAGFLPWLHPNEPPATSTSTQVDPYENLIDQYGDADV